MLAIADENIPHAQTCFGRLAGVRLMHGRRIDAEAVREADLLFVRSITKVNAALLAGSKVRFVGTATIGVDHIDSDWLAQQGIAFASAPGCNAESVAQYIAAALAFASARNGRPLAEASIGIVGAGHCGSRVERVAKALGMKVKLCDPPLGRVTGEPRYRPLDELLDSDYLTLHVPLTKDGPDPTWRLIDGSALGKLREGAIVINASRGGVVDEAALRSLLDQGWLGGAILDAWEGEPAIDLETADRVLLGTPHIAGYSYDGKLNGTRMIYEAACRALGVAIEAFDLEMPPPAIERIEIDARGRKFESVLGELILTAYPIYRDDADLRTEAVCEGAAMPAMFDSLRKNYPLRREFAAINVSIKNQMRTWPEDWKARVQSLGFRID